MKKRNFGIDCYRVLMLFWVIIYHLWVINGSVFIQNDFLRTAVTLGGEIGVTGFFVLSGWSIFYSIERMDGYFSFLKKRFCRIAPEYYLSIAIILFLSEGSGWLSLAGIKSVIATLLFLQNITPSLSAVNGVLWTMSVTVMFYIISPVLFKMMKKNCVIVTVLTCMFTIMMKCISLHYGPIYVGEAPFYLSRLTLLTDLDNFVIGMFIACVMDLGIHDGKRINNLFRIVMCSSILIIIVLYGMQGAKYGIHTDNISGYSWHTVIAILLSVLLYFCGVESNQENVTKCTNLIGFCAKHQYGIYIFHLIVIEKLVRYSELIQVLTMKNYLLSQCVILIISVGVGMVMSLIINYRKVC